MKRVIRFSCLLFSLLFLVTSCKRRTTKEKYVLKDSKNLNFDLDSGHRIYKNNCWSCHGNNNSSYHFYPSLPEMIKMDNYVLEKKLRILENDSLHKSNFKWKTRHEFESLIYFLTKYDGITY
jgi:mono/diheme cytochrome c family protein